MGQKYWKIGKLQKVINKSSRSEYGMHNHYFAMARAFNSLGIFSMAYLSAVRGITVFLLIM